MLTNDGGKAMVLINSPLNRFMEQIGQIRGLPGFPIITLFLFQGM
jgi:hypothetical protein